VIETGGGDLADALGELRWLNRGRLGLKSRKLAEWGRVLSRRNPSVEHALHADHVRDHTA